MASNGRALVVLDAMAVSSIAPTLVGAPSSAGLLQIRGEGLGVAPWAVDRVEVGGVPSRVVLWVSDTELLAYCEPGVGVDVLVSVHTLGGSSAGEQHGGGDDE